MKQPSKGFTLLEVAIAGAILLIGMLMVANVTRTVLDTSAPDSPAAAQNGPVIDAYLRAAVTQVKAARDNTTPLTFATMPYGNGTLSIATVAPPVTKASGNGYTLSEYELSVMLTQPGQSIATASHTTFWKLWRTDAGKAGV